MATRISPPQNKTYYINPAYLTFNENSGYGANLIQVSASSSCYISVYDPANGIGYSDADRNYRRWKVTAYNNKFPDNDAWNIYVRLERNGSSSLIIYDKILRGVKGGEITVSKDEQGNDVYTEAESTQETYWFVRIGDVTATDGNSIRQITYDTGYLESDEGKSTTDPNAMWELLQGVTPWLIRAKYWLTSFTVKGFIKLIGSLIFTNKEGEEKPIVDVMRTTDSGDPNEPNYVPIDDTTIPTTAWVKSQNDERYLKKYEPDETKYRIKFFDGIEAGRFVKGMIGGSGTQFDGQGYGEMNGLTLREFLEVPELRFNRIDVVSGELWNSVAFGLVEKVDTEKQICWIKLEEKERCGVHIHDICRGIFADFGDGTQWEGIDECGFQHLYGFWTAYFTPKRITENGEGIFSFEYELKPGTSQHPTASMKFAVYGNFTDASRQASAYSTRTYKRYLNKVDTWVIDPDKHIYAQYGDLEGLQIGNVTMKGYGSFQSNAYFKGVQIQLTPSQMESLKGESAYTAVLSTYEGVVTIDDEGRIVGGEMELLNVITEGLNVVTEGQNVVTAGYRLKTEVQAMHGSTPLFYSPNAPVEGSYVFNIAPVGCKAMVLNGVIVVTEVFNTERCYINVVVNCEGVATFTLTYNITAVRDGKNPIVADIDNEMDSVACDAFGEVIFGLPVNCTVSMWAGTGKLVLDRLEVHAPSGVSYTADKTTGTISVTAITKEAERTLPLDITAYASYGGTQYHKDLVFTVNKVNAGENALLYKLSPSASSVKVDDAGNMTADGITCEVVSSNGNTIETLGSLPADGSLTMQYYLDKDTPKNYSYKSEVKVGTSTKTVTFKLYSKGNLIDVETIPVIVDGGSPFVVDLDNEMQSVACNEKGAVVLGLPLSTGVRAYYGSKELEITSVSVGNVDGVTASVSGTTVSVTKIEQTAVENIRIPITVKARYDKDYTRTVYLIVNKLKQGNSAVVVDLVPSVSSIKVDSRGSYTPSSVSCKHKVTTGKDGSSIPAYIQDNYSMKVAIDGDTTPDAYTYGSALSVTSAKTSVTFYLYYNNVLVDQETVPVVKDGGSPVRLDLDNEMQSVACDENGKVTLGLPLSTGVKMYYGTEELSISNVTVSAPTGVTASKSGNTVTVTAITDAAAAVLKINISATASYGGETYTRSGTLTVNKLKQGNSAVVLDLAPSVTAVKVSAENVYTPTSVSCKVKQTTGKNGVTTPSSLPTGYSMKVAIDGDTTPDAYTYGSALSVTSAKTSVTFYLYYNNVLVDQETIPVVKDGAAGKDGEPGADGDPGIDASVYTVLPNLSAISCTMTGTLSPESVTFTCYRDTGTSERAEETAKWYARRRMSVDEAWEQFDVQTTYSSTFSVTFSTAYKYYRIEAYPYNSRPIVLEPSIVTDGKNGEIGPRGAMPRYCGEYKSGTKYVYNSEYRDIVIYEGNVYQVWKFASEIDVAPSLGMADNSNDGNWQMANKQSFVAMDTALVDEANIAGFTFYHASTSSLDNPVGIMQSQNGKLKLDSEKGEITALAGKIGDWEISDGALSVANTIESGLFTVNYENSISANGFSVEGASGFIKADFGLKNLNFEDSTWLTAISVKNGQNPSSRRSDDMCGMYLGMTADDIGIFVEGGSSMFRPSSGGITSIYGLSVRSRVVSSTCTLDTTDDAVVVTGGTVSLPAPGACPGKIYFIRVLGGTLSVPRMTGATDGSAGTSTTRVTSKRPRIFVSIPTGTSAYSWIEFYCAWD